MAPSAGETCKPKGFCEALAPGPTGCLDPAPPPSCSVRDQGPEPARLEACYKRRLLGSFDLWAWVVFFFFFVHPQSGLRQLCFSRIIPVPHPLHSSGRLVVGDPNQAPSPGPLPLEDERSWVSRTPAHPTVHAGAASCLQGWAPVSMAAAGGAPPGD